VTDVEADPRGGYVGVGSPTPGGAVHLWHLDEDFEATDLGSLGDYDAWRLARRDDHWLTWGNNHVFLADREGQLLASRELGEAGVATGVHGVVPTASGPPVLWGDWEGVYLERFDEDLRAVAHAEPDGLCCALEMTAGPDGDVFIHGRLNGLESPLWIWRVDGNLGVGPQAELAMGRAWLGLPTADASGNVLAAAREDTGGRPVSVFRQRDPLGVGGAPGGDHHGQHRGRDDEILVYENPYDNYEAIPVRIWSVAPDLTRVEGPIVMGTAVDVSWVERYRGGWRVLGYRNSTTWGSYGELWTYEGLHCE
jgi:hypothetical protein